MFSRTWMSIVHPPKTEALVLSGRCQGTPVVVPTRASIRMSALNKGGSGDPGAWSIIGRARTRTGGIRYIYTRNHSRYYLLIVMLLA
jgi:hypothetical protein